MFSSILKYMASSSTLCFVQVKIGSNNLKFPPAVPAMAAYEISKISKVYEPLLLDTS